MTKPVLPRVPRAEELPPSRLEFDEVAGRVRRLVKQMLGIRSLVLVAALAALVSVLGAYASWRQVKLCQRSSSACHLETN